MLTLCAGGFVLRNGLDLEQGDLRVCGATFFSRRLPHLFHDLRTRAGQLEPLGATWSLLAKRLPLGFTERACLAVLAGVGTALVARLGGFELAIAAQDLAFAETEVVEEVHCHGRALVDHGVTNAVAQVAKIVFARNGVMEPGELPVAPSLVAVVQVATELGVIDVLSHLGGHCEHDEAGRVVARSASGAVVGCPPGASEAEVDGGADEPPEAAVNIALRGALTGLRGTLLVREPSARCLGKRRGEGVAVVLVEKLSIGDKGVEIQGCELLRGKQ